MSDESGSPFDQMMVAVENLDLVGVRRLLLTQSLDLDAPFGIDGWTLLHLSIDAEVDANHQFDHPLTGDMTKLLLDSGADPRLRNAQDETPRQMAIEGDHPLAAELLRLREIELGSSD